MSKEIVNRVANSKLITIDLSDYASKDDILIFDVKDLLFEGIILKEASMKLATPGGWKPGKHRHKVGTDNLEFLRSEDGMDVYWNPETEEEEFTVQSNNKE